MHIFSVQAATEKGSSVCFHPYSAKLITADGTTFDIKKNGKLYFLPVIETTHVKYTRDLQKWHSILGHCNKEDVVKLEKIVDGMTISQKDNFICEPCILGKQTKMISREPSTRATRPLEFVSTDVCGPIDPVSCDGFRYVISFVDNFSGYIFIYFIKKKSDAANALQKILSGISPIGKVRYFLNLVPDSMVLKLRSDNGGEYMGHEFKDILLQNKIKHEQSAPHSPHQNGIAERAWHTLFETCRCLLIEAKLPKTMWPYALVTAALRNRCYQQCTKQTPHYLLTDRKPDLSNLHVFGSVCYTFQQNNGKLGNHSKQGVFVGYD